MNKKQPKSCEVCGKTFIPDHRVGDRQRVCKNSVCKLERKKRSQQQWIAKNPDYFQGRYPELKEWLNTHPGYLRQYRYNKKADVQRNSYDIQDELTCKNNSELEFYNIERARDIQDKIIHYMNKYFSCFQIIAPVIYKTR